jgi:hypothetical protein
MDNLGVDGGRDGLQLCLAEAGLEYLQVPALNGDDGEAGSTRTAPSVASLANKDLAHKMLLPGTPKRAVVTLTCSGHLPRKIYTDWRKLSTHVFYRS